MADNDLIQQALSRGYSIDEIANRLSEDAGLSPSDIRSRGYSSQEIIGTLGYSIPEVKQSMLDRAKSAVSWNAGRDFKVPEGQTVTDDSFSAGIPDIQNEKPKRNLLMENSIMRNSNGMPATEQTADLSSLPSVQKISTPSLQFERQKESNRKWLDNSKPLVVGQLMRDNNLSAEDAEIEFSRMRNAGVVPKATESGLREATWGEAFDSGIAKVKPSFDKSMAGLASIKSDVTGDFALSSMADALRQEANKQLAEADGILAGTSKDSWKKTISDAPASLAQNLPTVIAASALASNPLLAGVIGNIGLAGMGMISGGAAYAEGKDSGLNVSNNLQQSGLKALAEVIPEKMSLNVLVGALGKKAAEQAMKDSILQSAKTLGKYFGAEIGTEELTTIAQFGVDKMYSKPDMTMKDLVGQMIDTAKATLIQAPILGGTGILTKAAVDTAGRVVDPTGYQLRGWADAVDRTNFTPMQGGAENFDGYDQRMADVTANPFSRRMTRITQAEQTKQAAQAAIATAPTVDAAVDSFKVANAAGSASIVDQSALLNELTGNSGLDASIATADADAQALQAGIRDIDQHPTTLGERVSESGIPMGTQTGEQQATAHPMLEWLRNTSSDDVTTAVLANPALLQEIRPHVSDRVFQMISEDVAAAQSKTSAPALETATPPVQQAAPVPDVAGVVDVAETIKSLQSELSKAEPFSEQSSTITDKLHTAVHADAQSSLDAGEMPVYRVTDHVSVALHPSAQKEGMIQVTRYTKDGVIGDSQYNSVEEAIRNEGLIDRQRIDSAEAVKMIEQSIAAEADYQKRKSVEPIQPAIQATQQQGSTADGAIQPKPDLPEVTTVVPTFTPAAPPVAKSIKNWSANELQARLDRAASGESPLSAASEKTIREELNSRPSVQQSRKPIGLSIGVSPNAAEAVSVRSGVVYVGDYPAMDYETEADITVPDGATPQQIVAALRKGGAIASSSKVFGLAKAEKSDPLPKVDRKQIDPAKDSLFVAIAKLGGMDTQELLSNGFDQNDITYEVAGRVSKAGAKTGNYTKNTGRLGKKKRMPRMLGFNMPLHRNGGISFDGMLEALKQHGYFPEGATKNDAIEAFSRELGGEQVLTPEAVEAEMEAAQAAHDAEMEASDGYDEQAAIEAENAAELRAINAGYDALSEDQQAFISGMRKGGLSDDEINGYIAEFKRVREGNDAGAETSQSDSGTRSSEESDLHGESLGGKEGQAPEWLSTKRSEFRLEGQTNEQASEQKKEPELTKEQIDRERDGTPFTLEQESQPKPMGTQGSLFARQITADEQATVTNVADADLPANVKQTAAFLRVMSRILGKKIQWVSGANFDGMVKDSDTIYLNVDGDTNKVAVFGHEFWHQVEMTHKAVFDAVLKVVDPMFDIKQATRMFNDYYSKNASEAEVSAWLKGKNEQGGNGVTNRDFLIREFLSDTTGNRFTESDFWGDVFAKLEQREGHLKAVTLIRRFVKSLTDALNKLTNALKMQGFRTDNDLTAEQIGQVKAALSEGMAQYLQDTRYGTKEQDTVASGAKYSPQKDFEPDAELTAAAKKHFMLTLDVKEAGYIMPDGAMLDFSGKHYSSRSDWPYLRGQRNVDHRELTSENTHTNSTLESYFKTNDGNDIMEEFMSRTGAMRVDFNAGVSSIMRAPTDVQLKKLGQMKGWSATSYIDPDNGRIVADVEWDNTTPAKIRTFFAENVGKKAGDTAPKFSPMRTEITAVPMRSDEVAADKDNSHEYRLAVEKIAKERYASKPPVPVTINTTNEVVFISWGSASHILRDGLPDWKTSLAVLHMEGLIKSAERSGEFVPDYKGRKDPNGMYPYHSEAMIDGERHDVDITVRVHSDGHRYYDHIVVAKKTPAGLLESGDGLANSDAPTPPFTGADSNVAPDTPNNKYSPQRRFYSQLERTVEQTPDRIFATAPQFKLWLLANAGKFAIKKEEIQWTGITDWLDLQGKGKISKADVLGYLAQNGVQVQEVESGEMTDEAKQEIKDARDKYTSLKDRLDEELSKAYDYIRAGGATQIQGMNAIMALRQDRPGDGSDELSKAYDLLYKGAPADYDANTINDLNDDVDQANRELTIAQETAKRRSTKYASYVLPGATNYRELLLTLPVQSTVPSTHVIRYNELSNEYLATQVSGRNTGQIDARGETAEIAARNLNKTLGKTYRSSHWEESNILAHIRFNDRVDADGAKVLFVEEIQSDYAQDKRKGKDVPAAPFIDKTEAWAGLAIKRVIAYAVENGYAKVAFVNGQQSADRYDLSKQVKEIEYIKRGTRYEIAFTDINGNGHNPGEFAAEELEDVVGKEIAQKIINGDGKQYRGHEGRTLSDLDLKVGGEGMIAFYDKIIPQVVSDVLKKVGGGKMETVEIDTRRPEDDSWYEALTDADILKQPGFTVTDSMKAKVSEGLPLFSRQRAKISDMADKDTVGRFSTAFGPESQHRTPLGDVTEIDVDGVKRPALNSNGKPIHWSREGVENFWRWFGSSRVVDADGRPLVVYHGTTADVERFNLGFSGSDGVGYDVPAIFATTDQKLASDYSLNKFDREIADAMRAMQRFKNENPGVYGDEYERLYQAVKDAFAKQREEGRPELGGGANVISLYMRGDMAEVDANGKRFMAVMPKALPDAMAQGKDGVIVNDVIDNASPATDYPARVFVTFKPENVKSAIGNRGTFDGSNPDIRYSKQRTLQQSAIPEETKAQAAQRKIQDKFNRFTVIKDWLKSQGIQLSEQADVYKAEERMHSRFANKVEDFRTKLVEPLIKKIQAAGFSMDDVSLFLHAQHAEERNNQIAKINPKQPDGGSGMSTADANNVLAAADPALVRLANEFRQITEMTKQTLLDSGIVSQEMVDAWEGAYSNYIPLKGGPDEKASKTGTGKGLHVNGKMKRALGHGKREGGEWIVENILADYERAVMLAENNRVGHHLVKMALEVGRDDLITIGKPEKRAVLHNDSAYEVRKNGAVIGVFNSQEAARVFKTTQGGTGITITKTNDPSVIYSASPMLQDNEANVYVNGHAVRVQINDELLARAYKNLGSEAMPEILKAGRMLNNYLSKAYTGYNPEFILTNIVRDFTTGLINVTGEEGAVFAAKSAGNYLQSFGQMLRYAVTGQESRWIKDYRADGGNTGAAYLSDLERLGKEVQTEYASYKGVLESLKAKDGMGAARAAGRHAFNWSLKWIEHLNQAGENAMRLAIYRTAIESGKTRAEAASLSKNGTVNFNRRGEWGQNVNALYLFFNAGVQGTASLAHAHFKGEHKYQAWALSSAMIGLGYAVAAAFGGGDEDDYDRELSDYDKSRNLVIRAGDSWVKIPVPYGYGFFYNLGRHFADSDRKGEWGKMPWHLASDFVGEFTPFGGVVAGKEADSKQLVFALPTAAQIPGAVAVNRTGMGSSIFPENPFDKNMPDNLKMWRNTKGSLSDDLAQTLTGVGLEVSPETLKHLGRTATGGSGAFIGSVFEAGDLKMKGADLEVKEMPFVRKFVKEGSVSDYRSAFYEARSEASKAADDFARAKKMGDMMSAQRMARDNAELIAMDKYADSLSKMIKAKRDAQDAIKNDERFTVAEKRLKLKVMEAEEKKVYDRYLDIFKKRTDQRRERLDKAA